MKQLNGDYQPSPNVSYGASTSNQSKCDQESGSNTMLTQKDVTGNTNFSCHLPFGIDSTLARILVAEALGTFMLVFCIYGITASKQIIGDQVGLLEYGLTAIIAVTVVVSSIGGISGAHVNPAVTIAFATLGPFPWSKVPAYIVAQIVGASGGTYLGKLVYGMKAELIVTRPIQGSASAFFAEFIVTFIFLFMACSLINEAQPVGAVAGLLVGASIGLGILITVPVSGGSMNPARSLGPAIVAWKFDDLWIYIVAPTAGAVAGSLSYRVLCLRCNLNGSTSASTYNTPLTTQNRIY